jgi:hypothetical protein
MSNFSIRFPHCSLNFVITTAYVASQAAQAYGILANFTAQVVTEDGVQLFSLANLNLNQAKSGRLYITSKGEKINSANGERMIYPVSFLPQSAGDAAVDEFYDSVGTTILAFIKEAQMRVTSRKATGVGAMLQSELAKLSVPTKQEPVSVDDIPL